MHYNYRSLYEVYVKPLVVTCIFTGLIIPLPLLFKTNKVKQSQVMLYSFMGVTPLQSQCVFVPFISSRPKSLCSYCHIWFSVLVNSMVIDHLWGRQLASKFGDSFCNTWFIERARASFWRDKFGNDVRWAKDFQFHLLIHEYMITVKRTSDPIFMVPGRIFNGVFLGVCKRRFWIWAI